MRLGRGARGAAVLGGAALAAVLATGGCSGSGPDGPLVGSFEDGRAGGGLTLVSSSPYDFSGMIAGAAPRQEIAARLVLPAGDGPARGAAILSHGSGGTGARQDRMAELLAEAGYAALVLDHFGPRGIGSTVRDQLRVTEQDMLADVLAAQRLLATHPRVPADRIGVIGWSKGAITAVLAAVDRLAGYAAEDGERPAFAIAFYPFCGFALEEEPLSAPLLMLLGGADDWTPAPPCQRLAEAWAARGQPAEAVVYPGANHGFDARTPFAFPIGRAITVRDTSPGCTLTVDERGRSVTLDGRHGLDSIAAREAFLTACGVRGVTFGGDPEARREAYAEVLAFLERVLPEEDGTGQDG